VFGHSLIRLVDATALGFSTALTNTANASALKAPRFQVRTVLPPGLRLPAPKGGFPQIARSLDDKLMMQQVNAGGRWFPPPSFAFDGSM
jgi:hypothetical protein